MVLYIIGENDKICCLAEKKSSKIDEVLLDIRRMFERSDVPEVEFPHKTCDKKYPVMRDEEVRIVYYCLFSHYKYVSTTW